MKKKILFFILILVFGFIPFVSGADKPDALPVYVNSPISYVNNDLETRIGERVFWSNHTRLFYIVTHFDHDIVQHAAVHPIIGYAYSPDGVNWVVIDDFFEDISVHAWATKDNFDFAISPDGRYIWFAWHDTTVADLWILKCELFSNGTITPLTANQLVVTGAVGAGYLEGQIDIELSSEGYPFVAFDTHDGANTYFAYVRWCNDDSGIWVQDGQEWFDNLMTWNKPDSHNEYSKILRLENGKMAWAVDFADIGNSLWYLEVAFYDGTSWVALSAERVYGDGAAMGVYGYHRTDTASYQDIVLGTYVTRSAGFQRWYMESAEYNSAFINATEIVGDYPELTGRRTPNLGVNNEGDLIVSIHEDGSDSVNYTYRFSNYTWGPLGQANIVKWYDNNSQTFNWHQFTNSERFENYLGFVYHDNSYTDTELLFDYLAFDGNYIPIVMQHLNTTLYNQDGSVNDGWIFEGEVYDLVSYVDNITRFYVNTTDSRHQIEFHWGNETEQMWISVDPSDQFTIGLAHSEYERFGNVTRLLWRFIPNRNIIDCVNSSWGYYIENDYYNVNATGALGFNTHIYNLGGFTYYDFQGDGGRIIGGHPWELYATNGTEGSSARAEQIYRKLQHIHFLIEIDMDNEWDAGAGEFDIDPGVGWVDIGIDYRLNGTWVEGFFARLYVYSADVGHDNLGTDENYVEWRVAWYNYDPTTGTWDNKRSEYIYSNHWGYDNEGLTPDYHNRTSCQLWVDLWFDRTNASTAIAGQVNSMYFGYVEHGAGWWPGYGNFQPMRGEYENAMFLDDLYDEGGNVTDSMKYDLMRVFVEVQKVTHADGDDETWTIRAIENINRKLADDRMQGIEQPSFEETLVLEMPMFQSLNPLVRAIDGIASAVWKGALGFQKILWGAMDSFFAWAGFGEGFFSTITAFLMAIPELFVKMMENIPILIQNMVEIVEDVFGMVARILPEFVLFIGYLSDSIVSYWITLTAFFSGGLFPINIIQDLQLGDWIRAGFALLPAYEMFAIIWAEDSGKKAKERIDFYSMLFNGVINFIKGAISFMQQAIQTIMDILPG